MFWPLKKKSSEYDISDLNKNLKSDLDNLLKVCKTNLATFDEQLMVKAFHFCVEGYKNKEFRSGEPYYKHPLAVAHIVIKEIPLDQISVVCALLHDVVIASDIYTLKDIQSEFGQTIAEIVGGISKIQHIEEQNTDTTGFESSENYRKLLLSLFQDVRIILIKTAVILHELRVTSFLEIEEQVKIAKEALEIYSPFAQRFGLGHLKCEMEDLAFKILNPTAFHEISNKINMTGKEREEYIKVFTKPIIEGIEKDELFKKNHVKFDISGRAKHIYSIYNKIIIRKLPIEELNDLFAVRIIIDSDDVNYCYIAYGIINNIYPLVENTFKNYIASPKKNGYQSIHAALRGPDGSPVEIQIRTRKMHGTSEKGVASHFNYKRGFLPAQSVMDEQYIEEWLNLVKSVFDKSGPGITDELLDNIKNSWKEDEIYVFTPSREFKVFPKDATPLDFAFAIHSEIGEHCVGAKVNGKIIPLDYKLRSGDQVEILTSKNQVPSKDWLEVVVTQKAKSNIQKYLREQRISSEEKGLTIWNDFISGLDFKISEKKLSKIIKSLKFNSKEEFFISLGNTGADKQKMIENVKVILSNLNKKKDKSKADGRQLASEGSLENGVRRKDNEGQNFVMPAKNSILIRYAECCYPLPGDNITGIMATNGKEVVLHRSKCNKLKNLDRIKDSYLLKMDWENIFDKEYSSMINITGTDKPEILKQITNQLSAFGEINIKGINISSNESGFNGFMTLVVPDAKFLKKVLGSIRTISGIKSAERYIE